MPIHQMNYENGVFFAKQVGYLDNVDVRMWANALSNHAQDASTPVVAVVDMVEVNRICSTMPRIITDLLTAARIRGVVLVIGDSASSQTTRIISKLSDLGRVCVFPTFDEARRFAGSKLEKGGDWQDCSPSDSSAYAYN